MTTFKHDIPPLPGPGEYFAAAQELDTIFRANGGVRTYLPTYTYSESNRSTAMKNYMLRVSRMGAIVEPIDRSTGKSLDEELGTQTALISGASAGTLLVKNVHAGLVPLAQAFTELSVHDEDIDAEPDDHQRKHMLASRIIALGKKGLEVIGNDGLELVEAWESLAVPDVTKQPMFRTGLGLVALGGYRFHEKALDEANRALIHIGADHSRSNPAAWDEAFEAFFGDA